MTRYPWVIPRGYFPRADENALIVQAMVKHRGLVCSHAAQADGSLCCFVCSHHPSAGILCPPCFATHCQRHGGSSPGVCDACGFADDVVVAVMVPLPATEISAFDTAGVEHRIRGEFLAGAIQWCSRCCPPKRPA